MDRLQRNFDLVLRNIPVNFHRYMYHRINWENLIYALGQDEANIGNVRETFFLNQLRVNQDVITSTAADFQIGSRTFEVGGKNKKQKQLQGVENGFVVKDDIEFGYMNVIPLWQFGLNY